MPLAGDPSVFCPGFLPALVGLGMNPTPIAVTAGLFVSYHLMENFTPRQLFWVYVIVGSLCQIGRSYRRYFEAVRTLGPGGPPPMSVRGWFAAMALTAFARVDVFKAPRIRPDEFFPRGCIPPLPQRQGTRPKVNPLIPIRQLSQKTAPSMIAKMYLLLKSYEMRHLDYLRAKGYMREGEQLAAIFRASQRSSDTSYQCEDWRGGIAHVHGADRSVHVVLHSEDVGTVITAGWGERHPLCANDKRRFRFLFHGIWERPLPVPEGLVLVYGPRTNDELRVMETILTASVRYASRGELRPVILGESILTENQADMANGAEAGCQQSSQSSLACPKSQAPSSEGDAESTKGSDVGEYPVLLGSHELWAMPEDAQVSPDDVEAA